MAQRYVNQPLHPGDWINCESMMTDGFAGHPMRIVSVSRLSVSASVAMMRDGVLEFDSPQTKRKSSIAFVSDTFAGASVMSEASKAFVRRELEERTERKNAAIETALIGGR